MVWDGVANKTYTEENDVEEGIPSRTITIKDYPAVSIFKPSETQDQETYKQPPFQ